MGVDNRPERRSAIMSRDPELVREIRQRRFFHNIDLGDGLSTQGDSVDTQVFYLPGAIPDVRGKSVLDIGAWDGKFSFEAERAGAARVVALDHYVWRLDAAARQAYYDECAAEGRLPDGDRVDNGFLGEGTPGKRGFDLVHTYLDSRVEAVVDDFTTMDVDQLGRFDVVFYFGVLYHMVDPIHALKRLLRVTDGVAVIETAGVRVPGYAGHGLINFFAGDGLNNDFGNWFAPSAAALTAMCRAAGFRHAELKATFEHPRSRWQRTLDSTPVNCRLLVHAWP
jgi:tRNA (mo5U34)-methyltransferase